MTIDESLRGGVPRKAFDEALGMLGVRLKQFVISDLAMHRAYHPDQEYLDLARIGQSMQRLFGVDSSELIMERVFLEMDRLCSVKVTTT